MNIRKAVIPAAGLGTRFLPATKAQPKEMLPIINIPVIQYVVEEAISSGIDNILIITGKDKRAIEDHFDLNSELERKLIETGKNEDAKKIREIAENAEIYYVRQKEQKGLGDAIRYAEKFVGSEPFALLLGDDILIPKPYTKQLIDIFNKYQSSIICVEKLPKEKISTKGIIDISKKIENDVYLIKDFVEKPKLSEAPSDLGIVGRYILTPEIFECLKKTNPGINNEIQLTDALKILLKHQKIYAHEFFGKRYDLGNQLELVKTIIEFALEREDMKKYIADFIKSLRI